MASDGGGFWGQIGDRSGHSSPIRVQYNLSTVLDVTHSKEEACDAESVCRQRI
jgi:hypothetical protein